MSIKVRAATACQIARVDRQRFNEMVAAGKYPCAPETRPGSGRLFGVNDIVALYIFGRMTERGAHSSRAAARACEVLEVLAVEPDADVVTITRLMNGATITGVDRWPGKYAPIVNGNPIEGLESFDTRNIRNFVENQIEEYRNIIGSDD